MEWWTVIGAVLAGLIALSGLAGLVLIIGRMWHNLHDRQLDHMRQYGDSERNKWGLWK